MAKENNVTFTEELNWSKDTDGTWVYKSKDSGVRVPQLYIRKGQETKPNRVRFTVEFLD